MVEDYLPTRYDKLEREKLNPFIREVLGVLEMRFPRTPESSLLLDALVFSSLLACHQRVKIKRNLFDIGIYPNIYALKIIGSNRGKDAPFRFLEENILKDIALGWDKEFKEFRDEYENPINSEKTVENQPSVVQKYLYRVNEEYDSIGSEERKKAIKEMYTPRSWRFETNDATPEGLVAYAQTLKMWDRGLIYVRIKEFGTFFINDMASRSDFLSYIMEAFDTAQFGGKFTKGSKETPTVSDVPSVFMAGTSGSWISDDKVKGRFLVWLDGGNARRLLVCYPEIKEVADTRTRQERVREKIQNEMKSYEAIMEIRNKVLDKYLIDTSLSLVQNEDAQVLYAEYEDYCNERAEQLSTQVLIAEVGGRPWKAFRPAGIHAFLNGSNEINEKELGQAIYLTEFIGYQSKKYIDEQSERSVPAELLYKFLKENPRPHRKTDIRKKNFVPFNKFNFDELVEEANEYALQDGWEIIVNKGVGKGGGYTIEARQIPEVSDDQIPIMIAPKTTNYEKMRINTTYTQITTKWEGLHQICKDYCYMPQLNSGKRKRDNAIAGGVLMGLDVDDKWTLKEAKEYFTKENIKALLITTPSHQKEVDKSGKKMTKRDRFRVIILLDSPFTGDAKAWSNIMTNYMAHLNQVADTSCKDISRFFYPSPSDATYYYIAGEPLNWRSFAQELPQARTSTINNKGDNLQRAIEYASNKYGTVKEGERDTFLNEIWHYNFKNQGLGQQEVYEICQELNRRFCSPSYSDNEMKKWDRNS